MSVQIDTRIAGSQHTRVNRAGDGEVLAAALDLGTNNCRLLVATLGESGPRVIDAFSRVVRLGEGLEATGELSMEAQARAISALRICASKLRQHRPERARLVATQACRAARNGAQFLDRVWCETRLSIEIISPAEEARLAMRGCVDLIDNSHPHALIFDIGGGSTELIWLEVPAGAPPAIQGWLSIPSGVVTLADRHRHGTPRLAYAAMREEVIRLLAPFEIIHRVGQESEAATLQLLGSSGTITTIAGIHLDLARYDRNLVDGSELTQAAVHAVTERVLAMDEMTRATHPCIGRARADLVIAGCAILDAILDLWPAPSIRVADRGVREGILLDLAGRDPSWMTHLSAADRL